VSGVELKEMLWRHESNIRVITSAGRQTSEEAGAVQEAGSVASIFRSVSKSVTACVRAASAVPGRIY
jgi:DNA-binding NarL/FixJ family response regulator